MFLGNGFIALSLAESWCCKLSVLLSVSSRAVPLVLLLQDTVVWVRAWLKVLCLKRGSWNTPSTQFLRVVTGESCRVSKPEEGEVVLGEGLMEAEGGGWHRNIQEGNSV